MKNLSRRTLHVIAGLFPLEQQDEVREILATKCNDNIIGGESAGWDRLRERVQLGALKLSQQRIDALRSAVDLAQRDWRDLLVAAGFAHSLTEHETWAANVLQTTEKAG